MAYRKNTNYRNSIANHKAGLFANGTVQIRTGTQPASANDAASGTLLCTITLPASPFTAASGGVISKNGTWLGLASGTGTAGYARFISSSGLIVMDMSVAESGADLIIDDDAITSGAAVNITGCTITVQASRSLTTHSATNTNWK